ncbi:pyridoxal-phosphate dependent enzyme [Avibacterium sp. 20-126]|uniref:pyridoxal-phosphate dependent enzyme n=1 Tax=Avibacterium sp. 20-126 TaxID=2911524 RepID=UPI0037BF3611
MHKLNCYMGDTPLIKIKNIFGENYANVYVKLEEFNPAGSIKSRVANHTIQKRSLKIFYMDIHHLMRFFIIEYLIIYLI